MKQSCILDLLPDGGYTSAVADPALALMVVGAAAAVLRRATKAALRAVEQMCNFILFTQPSFVKLLPSNVGVEGAFIPLHTAQYPRHSECKEVRPVHIHPMHGWSTAA
jgi:hypothetical protein